MTGETNDGSSDPAREAEDPRTVGDPSDRQALATRLAERAEDDPDAITGDEMGSVVDILTTADVDADTRVAAAEAIQHLRDRPALFEPFVDDLLGVAEAYPDGVEGIPAPIEWMGDPDLRAVVYVADSLARVAQERPELFVPRVDRLRQVLDGDRNAPRYLLFAVGYAEAAAPGSVSRQWLLDELTGLLDRGRGNGYPSWAADTLGALGEPDALSALRAAHPGESGDEATRQAFDDAIAELEATRDAGR
ncbi:hypothetical protein [Halobellus sp. GM3]|uniref:hypothetical protein n=1 Tax=Halobellus sp. GM3 TaxID=3458410 RepID=UPI00403DF2B5